MSFDDPDPIEQDMGVCVERMFPDELVSYIKTFHKAFGLDLAVQGYPERQVFKTMQQTYGQRIAGRIVKWAFYHHKGKYNGRPIGFFDFATGAKWWVDQMHLEMQDYLKKTDNSSKVSVIPGARVVEF